MAEYVTQYPMGDGTEYVKKALDIAKKESKLVLLDIGGDWCGWSKLLWNCINNDIFLKDYLEQNFEVVKLDVIINLIFN